MGLLTQLTQVAPGSSAMPALGHTAGELALRRMPGLVSARKVRVNPAWPLQGGVDDVEGWWREGGEPGYPGRGRGILGDLVRGQSVQHRTPGGVMPELITTTDGCTGLKFVGNVNVHLEPNGPQAAIDIGLVPQTGYSKLLVIDGVPGATGAVNHVTGLVGGTSVLGDGGASPSFAIGYAAGAQAGKWYLRCFLLHSGGSRLDADTTLTLSAARTIFLVTASAQSAMTIGGVPNVQGVIVRVYKNGVLIAEGPVAAPLLTSGLYQFGRRNGTLPAAATASFTYFADADLLLDYSTEAGRRDDLIGAAASDFPIL